MGIDPMKLMRGMLISFVVLVLVVVLTAFLLHRYRAPAKDGVHRAQWLPQLFGVVAMV